MGQKKISVFVKVFEGEGLLTEDNHFLNKFEFTGIPPQARGVQVIEVTFEMDLNGILSISALARESAR